MVDDTSVDGHRLGTGMIPLRLSDAEWIQLQAGQCGGEEYLPYELRISAAGLVEAARLLPYQSFCNSTPIAAQPPPVVAAHLAQANALVSSQHYVPWVVQGRPATVLIHTSLAIAPPERYGPAHPFPSPVDPGTVSIGMERRGCEGSCPVYSVTLAADGTVSYVGSAFIAIPGHHRAQITAAAVSDLLDRFRQARFLSALPEYSGAYDGGFTALHLKVNGTAYQVVDESGLRVGLPTAIRDLEKAVDDATESAKWVVGNQETLASLDAEHWNFASTSEDNLRLYDRAIANKNAVLLERFLQAKAPVLASPSPGRPSWTKPDPPPLIMASSTGDLALVNQMVLTVGTPVPPRILFHCLLAAFSSGSLPMVNFWLDKGADPHLRPVTLDGKQTGPNPGVDALYRAVLSGNPDVVRRALGLGFKPNRTIGGTEPILVYVLSNARPANLNLDVIRVLLQAGANPNARSSSGDTALIDVRDSGYLDILIAAGADPNLADDLGYTPLIMHATDPKAVKVLLAAGADPRTRDKDGKTALDATGELGGCPVCREQISAALRARE